MAARHRTPAPLVRTAVEASMLPLKVVAEKKGDLRGNQSAQRLDESLLLKQRRAVAICKQPKNMYSLRCVFA